MAEPYSSAALEVAAETAADAEPDLLAPALVPVRDDIPPLKCCCGSAECVFLRHSNTILDSVEKDVHNAARIGKVRLYSAAVYVLFCYFARGATAEKGVIVSPSGRQLMGVYLFLFQLSLPPRCNGSDERHTRPAVALSFLSVTCFPSPCS